MDTIKQRIQQLPTHLADQIAAGEVIERPASVLKELLENSLDAGCTQIEVTVERGGIGLIRVQDNGVGICKEDLKLAIAPHATSKITSLSDLEEVGSYGFRGEALASISSVSRLRLSSSVQDQEFGWSIQREGRDSTVHLMPAAKSPGTVIEVRDLFFNTPARRHFLRSEKTELNYLEEVFKRIALSQPTVSFKFQQGEHLQKRLPACNSIEAETNRVAMLCGQNFVEKSYYVQVEANGLMLKGWLGSASAMRGQADLQYFYVNGRIVRDKVVMHAIRQAYQDICLPGRYPAYVLFFTLDPTAVDVNVHPTKHEVRFREARMVHAFLSYAITEGLKQGANQGVVVGQDVQAIQPILRESEPVKFDIPETVEAGVSHPTNVTQNMTNYRLVPASDSPVKAARSGMDFSFLRDYSKLNDFLDKSDGAFVPNKTIKIQEQSLALGKYLGMVGQEFMLALKEQSLVLVDIKATRRLLLWQELSEAYQVEGVSTRPLMMPKSFSIAKNPDVLENAVIDWHKLGFDISQMGHDLVLVRSVPVVFGSKVESLAELLPKLIVSQDLTQALELIIANIIQYEILSEAEVKALLLEIPKLESQTLEKAPKKLYRELSPEKLRTLFSITL